MASRGSSRSLHNSVRASFAVVFGLIAFDKTLPRFQAWHQSDMSMEWVHWVRSLPGPFSTTCHHSPGVWWDDSGE